MASQKDDRLKNIIFIRDGVYEIQISNGYREDGKRDRITETVYGTENDAIARRDEIKRDLKQKKEQGIKTANDGYTFLEVTKLFLEDKKYGKRVGSTVRGYKNYLNNYILPEFGAKKLRNIDTKDLEKLYEKMAQKVINKKGETLSGTTIKHTHTLIKTIFNYAIHNKWCFYNPAEFVDNKPKADTKERDYYDHDEIEIALNTLNKIPEHKNGVDDRMLHSQNLRFKTAITILFNSGLRKEELFGLKWQDIKWNTHIFEIRRAVIAIDAEEFDDEDVIEVISNALVCKKLKNDSSRRNIVMPIVCFDLLNEYRKDQIASGLPATDNDYIFQNVRSKMCGVWNPNNLTKEWVAFTKSFNLKHITVHDIRHSHATDLLSMGVPIQDVSRRLGHSDVATTLKIYTHSNLEQDKLIAQRLEERYGNHFVADKLSFKVVASIITGESYAEDNDIIKAINYITGKAVNNDNKELLLSNCKDYILKEYSYLENITLFLNSNITDNAKQTFIDLISNVSNNLSKIRPMNVM